MGLSFCEYPPAVHCLHVFMSVHIFRFCLAILFAFFFSLLCFLFWLRNILITFYFNITCIKGTLCPRQNLKVDLVIIVISLVLLWTRDVPGPGHGHSWRVWPPWADGQFAAIATLKETKMYQQFAVLSKLWCLLSWADRPCRSPLWYATKLCLMAYQVLPLAPIPPTHTFSRRRDQASAHLYCGLSCLALRVSGVNSQSNFFVTLQLFSP